MKVNAIVNQLKNIKTKNKSLNGLIREMIADLEKPEVSKEILEIHTIILINNTKEQDLKIILQFLIQIQHLNKLNNLDEHILLQEYLYRLKIDQQKEIKNRIVIMLKSFSYCIHQRKMCLQ
ncbi:unnamed protein product [Paramecium pentaurelia]|uniref:Uncharacterized protein n=1 Tax=Paramecium pentaurelia TaxID=43138 RepID=A0A8S1SE26_9CILI|nr:unnamed protein product [Paramecium pentaurelia]